jgi:2-oxoglutarate dehydrogenase E1 component
MKFVIRHARGFSSLKNPQLSGVLSATSANYLEHLYGQWVQGQAKDISPSLEAFFGGLQAGVSDEQLWEDPREHRPLAEGGSTPHLLRVKFLVEAYRRYGHHLASIDPLGLSQESIQHGRPTETPQLSLQSFGLSEADLARSYPVALLSPGFKEESMALKDILARIKSIYCENVGFEFMHINAKEERDFITARIELLQNWEPTKEFLMETFHSVSRDYAFASFLELKFNASKRFGIEGCESVISGLEKLAAVAAQSGV